MLFAFISLGKGKMLAENEFWICAVVGEFLILVLIFDIILYYKDHGLIYRVSSICKARKPPVNECQKGKTVSVLTQS